MATTSVKMLIALSLSSWFGLDIAPHLATTVGIEMPWPAQLGVVGVLASLLWWAMARTIPQVSKDAKDGTIEAAKINAAAMERVASGLECVQQEIRSGNERQIATFQSLVEQFAKNNRGNQNA